MAAKEIVVKKYVVRLSCGERSLLETMIRKGSNPAQRLRKATASGGVTAYKFCDPEGHPLELLALRPTPYPHDGKRLRQPDASELIIPRFQSPTQSEA